MPLVFVLLALFFGVSTNLFASNNPIAPSDLKTLENKREFDYFNSYQKIKNRNDVHLPSKTPSAFLWLINFFSKLIPILFVSLFVLVALFILYSILVNNRFSKYLIKSRKNDVVHTLTEMNEEDISENNFDYLILQAQNDADYRLILRLMYLKILQLLHAKSHITYKKNKTNYEYGYEINNLQIREEFLRISAHFDWLCYGKTSIDQQKFQILEPLFKKFIHQFD